MRKKKKQKKKLQTTTFTLKTFTFGFCLYELKDRVSLRVRLFLASPLQEHSDGMQPNSEPKIQTNSGWGKEKRETSEKLTPENRVAVTTTRYGKVALKVVRSCARAARLGPPQRALPL